MAHCHDNHCHCGGHHHDHPEQAHQNHDHCTCAQERHEHHHDRHCCCGHDHDHDHDCGCGHEHRQPTNRELPVLLTGAGLFVLGLVLEACRLPGWPAYLCGWLLLGWQILVLAGKNLVKGHVLDENFLMGVATLAAICIGQYPEAVGILLFYRAGEYFQHRAERRSRSRIMEAVDLRPQTVRLADGRQIPAEQAAIGDLLLIRPGDRIGLDGTVISGQSLIDTAPITGEPMPVAVGPEDAVISGCINTQGALVIRVDAPLSESMVTRILRAVEGAAAGKPKIQRFITRFARVYTPAVVCAALAVAVIPALVTGDWHYWIYTGVSFLVMSCPCALVLSVPLAFFCGIGTGSKQGILFKDGGVLEALAQVKVAALDKTGTLTRGQFRVQPCDRELLALCAACEQYSTHPIAVSICSQARQWGLAIEEPESVTELPGMGLRAEFSGQSVLCGNAALLAQAGISVTDAEAAQVHLARNGAYLGSLSLTDELKADAPDAVAQLKKLGLLPAMLTGDRKKSAAAVAGAAGIGQVHAQLLPEEKLSAVQRLRQTYGPVLFVGDGINDAPVLAGADVGAAMGSGTDAAIEAADVVFLSSRVSDIPQAVSLARRTRAVARQNVIFALGFKLLVMLLGLFGLANLWLAVFADSGVAALCVLNAVRLLKTK